MARNFFSILRPVLPVILPVVMIIPFRTLAQYRNVMISDQDMPNETSIFMNPKNPFQLIAGANLSAYYYSNDGGVSWGKGNLTSSMGVYGDPSLVIDTAGYFYFFHLSYPGGNPNLWLDRIVCQRSVNNGLSWNDGSGIGKNDPKQQDKEWVVVNPFNNELYVTWTQFDVYGVAGSNLKTHIHFSKSSDQGLTWTSPVQLDEVAGDCIDSDNTVEGAVPAVGPQGEIYTSWAGPAGLVFDRSTDGGATWLDHDIFVSDIPGGWDYAVPGIYRANGLPVTCCDLSNGPNRGSIYINWSDQRNGTGDTDIWLAKSNDGGDTWSAPIRVNDDVPGKQQFFTWMTVDQATGYLWFVFYDRRNYEDTRTDVYAAVSTDGGSTFSNFRISQSPFIPNSNVFFGDYTGITAHNNHIRPIWTRLDNTDLSVWTALIDSLNTGTSETEAIPFALEQNHPNPFTESTAFSFKLRNRMTVSLTVEDLYGNVVATIIRDENLESGKHIRVFDPASVNIPSGVYYFRLRGNGISRQQKIVYLH